jgi:cbb3-type cytochrome c oxidase subunit III
MRRRLRLVGALPAAAALLAGACGPSDPGERVWARKCSACHGREGRGDTRFAAGRPYAVLTDDLWKHGGDLASIRRLVANGDAGSPMPAYEGRLSAEELDAVSRHVRKLWERAHGTPAPEGR